MLKSDGQEVFLCVTNPSRTKLSTVGKPLVASHVPNSTLAWVSDDELLVIERDLKTPPQWRVSSERRPGEYDMRLRTASWSGTSPTCCSLDTAPAAGATEPLPRRHQLTHHHLTSGHSHPIGAGNFRTFSVSPNGRYLLTLDVDESTFPLNSDITLTWDAFMTITSRGQLVMFDIARGTELWRSPPGSWDIDDLVWEGNSHFFVIPQRAMTTGGATRRHCLLSASDGSPIPAPLDGVRVLDCVTMPDGPLLLRLATVDTPDFRWIALLPNGAIQEVKPHGAALPARLVSIGQGLAGVADGLLLGLRADLIFRPIHQTPSGLEGVLGAPGHSNAVCLTGHDATGSFIALAQLDLAAGQAELTIGPIAGERPLCFAGNGAAVALVQAQGRNSRILNIWTNRTAPSTPLRMLHENAHLDALPPPQLELIEYRANGRPAVAWLLKPATAAPPEHWPLVSWIYPGMVFGKTPPSLH